MNAPPQYSPDGRWWWTGDHWVPTQQPIQQQRPITGQVFLALLGFGLLVALVVGVALIAKDEHDRQERLYGVSQVQQ